MNRKMIAVLILLSSLTICFAADGKPQKKKANIQVYLSDLEGDGRNKNVEVEYKGTPTPQTTISVKNSKKGEVIDSITIPVKITKIEFQELNYDRKERIFISFEDKDGIQNIVVYQFGGNQLSKIFSASSAYGIETDFSAATRIKIGKGYQGGQDSPNRVPDWDSWIWCGDKFIME